MALQKDTENVCRGILRGTGKMAVIKNGKRQLKYLEYIKRKESLKNLALIAYIEFDRDRGNQRAK